MESNQHSALLLFQIGPVQEFIAQARSTRDLWSGSYLLSWMIAHAAKEIAEAAGGPESLIFPALKDQPLYQHLCKQVTERSLIGIPNFPNRLLALVPADFDVKKRVVDKVFRGPTSVWQGIADSCLAYLERDTRPLKDAARELWEAQVDHFWQTSWQLWPLSLTTEERLKQIPLPKRYRSGSAASEWVGHYLLAAQRLDARRQTRAFVAAPVVAGADRLHAKDGFSGRDEAILSRVDFDDYRSNWNLRFLFRKDEALAAPNLIKRLWPDAVLRGVLGPRKNTFDSVPAVAAAAWVARLRMLSAEDETVGNLLLSFANACFDFSEVFDEMGMKKISRVGERGRGLEEWLDGHDASLFHLSTWESWVPKDSGAGKARDRAVRALKALCKHKRVGGSPAKYFAVLAMDGDRMGRWLSGDLPNLQETAITESYHRKFSLRLAHFALYAARPIVEAHHGSLIYAGGDDVLAILPATEAVACAESLRLAFRGEPALAEAHPSLFKPCEPGRIHPAGMERSLEVPGLDATMSGGIAMGHLKAPLQDVVQAAGAAEKRVKQAQLNEERGADALGISLFKRSGTIIHCDIRFESAALAVLEHLAQPGHYRSVPDNQPAAISGRFPHAVAAAASRYRPVKFGHAREDRMDLITRDILIREVEHLASRMIEPNTPSKEAKVRTKFLELSRDCHEEFAEAQKTVEAFADLLAVEAFCNRID